MSVEKKPPINVTELLQKVHGNIENNYNSEDSEVFDDLLAENDGKSLRTVLSEYIFLFWDGLGFFGTDVTKLHRLKHPNDPNSIRWYDKFTSCQWMSTTVIMLFIAI